MERILYFRAPKEGHWFWYARTKWAAYSPHWDAWWEDIISPVAPESRLSLGEKRKKKPKQNISIDAKIAAWLWLSQAGPCSRQGSLSDTTLLCSHSLSPLNGGKKAAPALRRLLLPAVLNGNFLLLVPCLPPTASRDGGALALAQQVNTLPGVKILSKSQHWLFLPPVLWSELPGEDW